MEVYSWENPQALFLTSRALHFPTAAASAAPQRPAATPTRRATPPTSPGHAASAAAAAGAIQNGLASEKWHQEGPKHPTPPTGPFQVLVLFWTALFRPLVSATEEKLGGRFGGNVAVSQRELGGKDWPKNGDFTTCSFTKKTEKVLALVSQNLRARNDLRINGIFFYNCAMICIIEHVCVPLTWHRWGV